MSTTHTGTIVAAERRTALDTPLDPIGSPSPQELASGGGAVDAQTIATLRAGDVVDSVFACVRKERLITRSGDPYLAVELRDQSGSLSGRVFRDADLFAGRFERGETRAGSRACGAVS